MIYLKTEIDGQIREIEIYGDEIFTKCYNCGKEFQVDDELQVHILQENKSFAGISLGCGCVLNNPDNDRPTLKRIK